MKILLEINLDDKGKLNIIKNELDTFRKRLESKSTDGVITNVRIIDSDSKYGAPTTKQINYAKRLIKEGKIYVDKHGEVITDPELMSGEEIYDFIRQNPPKNNQHHNGGYHSKYGSTSSSNEFRPLAHVDYDEDDLPF